MKKAKNKNKKSAFLVKLSNIGTGKEKTHFIENLAMMLSSGMGIIPTLSAIKEEMQSKRMKEVLSELEDDISSGTYIWRALKKTQLLPEYVISLIRIGEDSGNLPENLKVIAEQQEKQRTFKSKIRSAMMYPVLVFSITAIVGVGISWFILPKLSSVFSSLDLELPLITKILIGVGEFLNQYGIFAIPAIFTIIIVMAYFAFFYYKTKWIGEAILYKVPGIRKLMLETELSRAGYMLGTLLNAGVPIVKTIEALQRGSTSKRYKQLYAHLKNNVQIGETFQTSFREYKNTNKLIPATIQQMIVSGEKSGNLPKTLLKIGRNYEEKTNTTAKNLIVMMEPVLLVIIWVGVVTVALAVVLPIYSLIGQLR